MMRVCFTLAAAAATLAILPGCARRTEPVVTAPPPPPVVAAPAPRPQPPGGASPGFALPERYADGGFASPNRDLTPAATAWHLRAALNVAALRCNDDALVASYNGFVRTHGTALRRAHDAALREAGGMAAFDGAMTQLYNYFALPPVQSAFCIAAATIADEAARTPAGEFARFAALGLPVLEAPFQNFFRDYADYRVALARWEAGTAAPRLPYDQAVLWAEGPPRRRGVALAVVAR